jgi:hypothetical protein
VVAALAVAFLLGFADPDPDPMGLDPIRRHMTYPGVEVTVVWADCNMVNALYVGGVVVMCTELLGAVSPGTIRWIFAHEMAHAVIAQRDVPYTTHNEAAADELATLTLLWMGREDDVMEAATHWWSLGRAENPSDDHLGDQRRAVNLGCLALGRAIEGHACTNRYRRATRAWIRLLEMNE